MSLEDKVDPHTRKRINAMGDTQTYRFSITANRDKYPGDGVSYSDFESRKAYHEETRRRHKVWVNEQDGPLIKKFDQLAISYRGISGTGIYMLDLNKEQVRALAQSKNVKKILGEVHPDALRQNHNI